MRLFICLIPMLCGCSTPPLRCDAHLQPINAPAASGTSGTASEAADAAQKTADARSTP
jgi:hypothetical protein